MMESISVVSLAVRDLPEADAFYRRAFGGKAERKGSVSYFRLPAGVAVAVVERQALADYLGVAASSLQATVLSVNLKTKDAVDTAFATAIGAGGTPCRAPAKADWGGYVAAFTDPDGHIWEFVWNPRPFL